MSEGLRSATKVARQGNHDGPDRVIDRGDPDPRDPAIAELYRGDLPNYHRVSGIGRIW